MSEQSIEQYGTFVPVSHEGTTLLHASSVPNLIARKWAHGSRFHSQTKLGSNTAQFVRPYTFNPKISDHQQTVLDRILAHLLPTGSLNSSAFNLCSATLGGGALSLPFGFMKASIIPTLVLLCIAGVATVYSIWLLINIYEVTGIRTYEESTESLAGMKMRRLVEILTIIFCYGCAVAYVIAVGDALAPLQAVWPYWSKHTWMVLFWGLFMLPPSCQRAVHSLRFTSMFGMCAMLYLTFAIVCHTAFSNPSLDKVEFFALKWESFVSMPIVLFAYTCQINVFAIYDELTPQTPQAMHAVTIRSITFCFLIYTLIGVFGYWDFGPSTLGNIMSNYNFGASWIIQLAYIAMALAITMAFPLVMYPLRVSVNLLLFDRPQLEGPGHFLGTFVLSLLIVAAALWVPGINVVFQLLGSTTSSLLCFIIPAYLAWQVGAHHMSIYHRCGIWAVFLLGWFIGILGTVVTVLSLIQDQ